MSVEKELECIEQEIWITEKEQQQKKKYKKIVCCKKKTIEQKMKKYLWKWTKENATNDEWMTIITRTTSYNNNNNREWAIISWKCAKQVDDNINRCKKNNNNNNSILNVQIDRWIFFTPYMCYRLIIIKKERKKEKKRSKSNEAKTGEITCYNNGMDF